MYHTLGLKILGRDENLSTFANTVLNHVSKEPGLVTVQKLTREYMTKVELNLYNCLRQSATRKKFPTLSFISLLVQPPFSTHLSKNCTFTNFKKCDKIYLKLIDTKINYNSSQLTASEGHSDIYAIGVLSELRERASPNP